MKSFWLYSFYVFMITISCTNKYHSLLVYGFLHFIRTYNNA